MFNIHITYFIFLQYFYIRKGHFILYEKNVEICPNHDISYTIIPLEGEGERQRQIREIEREKEEESDRKRGRVRQKERKIEREREIENDRRKERKGGKRKLYYRLPNCLACTEINS